MPTDKKSINEYNSHFEVWAGKKGIAHTHLEKPAMYSALGRVRGKTILCLGCGNGEECAHIKSLGARRVVGVDIAPRMIDYARKSYPGIEFKVMDMEKLKFPQSTFDLVFSSLVLHYVKDWSVVLAEVKKVLKKDGIFLFSCHNPVYWGAIITEGGDEKSRVLGYKRNKKTKKIEVYGDYLTVRKIHDTWFDNFKVTYYHKPFSSILKDMLASGFNIVGCIEPKPLRSAKKIDYVFWKKASRLPLFMIFKLQK